MSGALTRPDWDTAIKDLARRVGNLERRTTPAQNTDRSFEITFSFAGTITATASPPKRVWKPGNLGYLAVTMADAGSTSSVLTVERNGIVVATVTVPSGWEVYNGEVGARFAADDIIAVVVTTAGTGAANMTCDARFT